MTKYWVLDGFFEKMCFGGGGAWAPPSSRSFGSPLFWSFTIFFSVFTMFFCCFHHRFLVFLPCFFGVFTIVSALYSSVPMVSVRFCMHFFGPVRWRDRRSAALWIRTGPEGTQLRVCVCWNQACRVPKIFCMLSFCKLSLSKFTFFF